VGAANQALEVLGVSRHPGDLNEYDRVMHGLRERLGDDEFEQLYAEGARMSLRGAVALALSDADVEPRSRADSAAPR
jgi:hypothetical protein